MSDIGRRELLKGLGVAAATSLLPRHAHAAESATLSVFVPTLIRTRALQEILQPAFSGVRVSVFARFADFMAVVTSTPPTAALSLADGLESMGFTPVLQGVAAGESWERYVLLTEDQEATVETIASQEVGFVDVVGRRELPALVQRMLGLSSPPQVRRVLKLGDLLPLLSLNLSAGILIPKRFAEEVRAMSRLELRVLEPADARLRRVAVTWPQGQTDVAIESALRTMPKDVRHALGVDAWRAK